MGAGGGRGGEGTFGVENAVIFMPRFFQRDSMFVLDPDIKAETVWA